jgi:hypothetical protein
MKPNDKDCKCSDPAECSPRILESNRGLTSDPVAPTFVNIDDDFDYFSEDRRADDGGRNLGD